MAKAKRPFMSGYRTYSPETEGYGGPAAWRSAFRARMSPDEARATVGDSSPRGILGVDATATWGEIKRAYRRLALKLHPDRAHLNGMTVAEATEAFKRLTAAYTILEDQWTHS